LRKTTSGSPPQAWGQSPSDAEIRAFLRFTPTGVGTICASHSAGTTYPVHPHGRGDNGSTSPPRPATASVHPHGRGDNCDVDDSLAAHTGSPPRAWGQYIQAAVTAADVRFTPTGVGTMKAGLPRGLPTTVHPHGRGDNNANDAANVQPNGSPPRAWGQLRSTTEITVIERFTPTGVGTIAATPAAARSAPVHPHGRGDNTGDGAKTRHVVGSPPRAWGQ